MSGSWFSDRRGSDRKVGKYEGEIQLRLLTRRFGDTPARLESGVESLLFTYFRLRPSRQYSPHVHGMTSRLAPSNA